jgi:glycosyltransferase involved in cell wall biosynthesis
VRIVFFVQHLGAGGVVRQAATQAEQLERRGHSVSLVALFELDEAWKSIWQRPARVLLPRPAATLLPGAVRRLRGESPDVLYAYQGNLARFIAWIATRRSATTLVWGVQGTGGGHSLRTSWKLAVPFHLCKLVSSSVPLMIANSEAAAARRKTEGFRCRRQLAIPIGIDTDAFRPDPAQRARVRAEWDISEEPLIGAVGRIDRFKGGRTFLEAAAALARRRSDVRFVLVGGGPSKHMSELKRLSRELGLAERLHWTGFREDMPAVYNALDVLCSASEREGFPNVIGEAMACGVPCVVTDVGDSAAVVADSGIIVPPREPGQLADALETMLRKRADLQAAEIRRLITTRFSIDRWIDATEAELAAASASSRDVERQDLSC